MTRTLLILLAILLSGCTSIPGDRAVTGQTLDSVTTVAAISEGFVEQNGLIGPLLPVVIPLKVWLAYEAGNLAHDDCVVAKQALGGLGYAMGAWNALLIAGATHPVGALLAVAAGWYGADKDAAVRVCPK
jgi:hypothetical protein